MDKEKIEASVRLFLEGIGEDPNREGLVETPQRVSRMCEELFCGLGRDPGEYLHKTFAVTPVGMVLERGISFYSVCEHHLLPFFGVCHVAYLPEDRVVGLSKLARTVELYARRPQIQEQMTAQIADAVFRELSPQGVLVVVEAEHLCMSMRGVKKPGTKTVTYACHGKFEEDPALLGRTIALLRGVAGIDFDCESGKDADHTAFPSAAEAGVDLHAVSCCKGENVRPDAVPGTVKEESQ